MKFKMEVGKLGTMMGLATKASGNGKFLPITAYALIKLEDGELSITCTNMANYITVTEKGVEGENGICIVHADKLNKLIQKTTVPELKFEQKGDVLEIRGNGVYRLPVLDEKYPTYTFNEEMQGKTLKVADLKGAFLVNRSAVSKDMATPYLTGYSVSNKCITTDGVKMCINDVNIGGEDALLLPQELVDLLEVLEGEEVSVQHDENKLMFKTGNITIFGTELSNKEEYPEVSGILEFEFPYDVEVNKGELLAVLDRILIFTNPFDNNGVKLIFRKDDLQISDLKENNVEVLAYTKGTCDKDVELIVNIAFLISLANVVQTEAVHIFFGNPICIKIQDGSVTEILCLMSVEE